MKNYCFTKNIAILIVILAAISPSIADINDGLFGYWRFDEEDGHTIVYDSSGNENHGITIGDPSRGPGVSGTALAFDGVNDYVEIPDSNSLHSDRQVTITGWFFLDKYPSGSLGSTYDDYSALVWKGNRPNCNIGTGCVNREYSLWIHKDGHLLFVSTPKGAIEQQKCGTGNIVQIKRWYHFGAVVNSDQGRMRLYVDGNLEGENTSYGTSNIRNTSGPLLFGGDEYDPDEWRYPLLNGLMDEVRIYGRALSQDEIQWLYEYPCMFELLGDVNNDCVFNFLDFAIMAANWCVNCNQTPDDPACVYIGPEIPDGMVLIPGGEFEMGDHFGEGRVRELPIHMVYLDSFMVGRFEVTNQEFCEYLNDSLISGHIEVRDDVVYAVGGSEPYWKAMPAVPLNRIWFTDGLFSIEPGKEDHPIHEVTWFGATAYCNWRSIQGGYEECYDLSTWECDFTINGYRLPTEAEWEYAARGGLAGNRYALGNTIANSQVNYDHSGDPFEAGDFAAWTTPVGFYDGTLHQKADHNWPDSRTSYQTTNGANGYGLYDMVGNVREWCNDWYQGDYYESSPMTNPTGPLNGNSRVTRGGTWSGEMWYCRVADRGSEGPSFSSISRGFRIVLGHN